MAGAVLVAMHLQCTREIWSMLKGVLTKKGGRRSG
jgi:hypothetical protein